MARGAVTRGPRVVVPATVDEVTEAAVRTLGMQPAAPGSLRGPIAALPCGVGGVRDLVLHVAPSRRDGRPDGSPGSSLTLDVPPSPAVPYFGWIVTPVTAVAHRRALRWTAEAAIAGVRGVPPPGPPHGLGTVPPVPVSPEQAVRLAAIMFCALVANAQGTLLTQFVGTAADTFGASDTDIGAGLAAVRAGALVSMVAAGLADRVGRRRVLVGSLGWASVASAATAVAWSFGAFVAAQLVVRSLTSAILVVAAIAVVEEAPEGARAWAVGMLGLALGAGFGLGVVLLPLADISGDQGWRVAFAVGSLAGLLLPGLRDRVRETRRYRTAETRVGHRGRLRQVLGEHSRPRFLALTAAVFLVNVFSAPSSQLTNRFLVDERDFSNTAVALYRVVALGAPGVVGVLVGGVLAERWGRRPVGATGVGVAAALQAVFFLTTGPAMWLSSAAAVLAASAAGVALGAVGAELFPTEVRGTSNGLLLVMGVLGSATGLVVATRLAESLGSLGAGVAVCGLAPVVTAAFILPWLPETRARPLEEISPSEP